MHGVFKSICDSFAISLSEFDQIFGGGQQVFDVWDTERAGITEGLELFTGALLYADSRSEDNLKALFELFDFNEIQSLSRTDLEYMFICCMSSSLKLHGMYSYFEETPVMELVSQHFQQSSRISLDQVLHFVASSDEISQFFKLFRIRHFTPRPLDQVSKDMFQPLRQEFPTSADYSARIRSIGAELQAKVTNNMRGWIEAALEPLTNSIPETAKSRAKVKLGWVFGIRTQDTRHNIKAVPGQEILVYFISSVVVVFHVKLMVQYHYTEHKREVISVAVGRKDIACSGELAPHPKIHVWKISTRETLAILSGIHQGAIPLLEFSSNDEKLISCSIYTLVIYEWKTHNILMTTNHSSPISDLMSLPRVEPNIFSFLVGCEHEFTIYSIEDSELSVSTVNIEGYLTRSPITCLIGQFQRGGLSEASHTLLTGHEDGAVLIWNSLDFQRQLTSYNCPINAMERFFENYAIGTFNGHIYIWNDKLDTVLQLIEMVMLPFKLMSFEISSLHFCNNKLFCSTITGDIIEFKLTKKEFKCSAKRIPGIVSIPNKQNAICYLSDKLPFIIFGGENGVVCVIDLRTYDLLDTWALGHAVCSVRAKKLTDHFVVAVGCESGALKLRQDWTDVINLQLGNEPITHLEFLKTEKIICSSSDGFVYIVDNISGSFQKGQKVYITTGIPLSVNVNQSGSHGIIVTDKRKLMMVDCKTLDLNFTFNDVSREKWKSLSTFYSVQYSHQDSQGIFHLPVQWSYKADSIVCADCTGNLLLWKNAYLVNKEEGLELPGHTSFVKSISLHKHIILSVGYEDRSLFLWRLDDCKVLVSDKIPRDKISKPLVLNSEYAQFLEKKPKKTKGKYIQNTFLEVALENFNIVKENADKPPQMSLKIKHIYGNCCFLRNSLFYTHFHINEEDKIVCERIFCYFVSKYGVSVNPASRVQNLYTFHTNKITCMDIHPKEPIGAIASYNIIHVYNLATQMLMNKIDTKLDNVHLLRFSIADSICLIGTSKDISVLELFNWKLEMPITKVSIGDYLIQDCRFHPIDPFCFAICGISHFSLWKRFGNYLKCSKDIEIDKELTVMEYIMATPGLLVSQQADILVGTNQGELLLCIEGRLLVQTESAHQGAVLCIKLAEYNRMTIILTTGMDGYLRIWTSGLRLLNEFHISLISDPMLSHSKQHFITNMSVYSCGVPKTIDKTLPKGSSLQALLVLLGTSGGAIIEVNLSELTTKDKLRIQYSVYSEAHSIDERPVYKQLLAVHPSQEILATVGEDSMIKIWDFGQKTLLLSRQLDKGPIPTAVKFSSKGFLSVGMSNGVFLILVPSQEDWGKSGPLETQIMFTSREHSAAILSIEFSVGDRWLALSFDNLRGSGRRGSLVKTSAGQEIKPGFVVLYELGDGGEPIGLTYRRFSRIDLPFGTDLKEYPSRAECAVVGLEFSQDESYIGFFHQRIMYADHVPNFSDYQPILMIYDIMAGAFVDSFEILNRVFWSKLVAMSLFFSTVKLLDHAICNTHTLQLVDDTAVIVGDSTGTLRVCRVASLFNQLLEGEEYNLIQEGYDIVGLGKSYQGHIGPMTNFATDKGRYHGFSTSFSDNAILQWEIVREQKFWEFEYMGFDLGNDMFGEVPSPDEFYKGLSDLLVPRKELYGREPRHKNIGLEAVSGRRARDTRNNIKYDCQDRVIYSVGSFVVIYSPFQDSAVYLSEMYTGLPVFPSQISAITISKDRRILCYGTREVFSSVFVWDVSGYVLMTHLVLPDCCDVLLVRLASDNRHGVAVGLNTEYKQVLYLFYLNYEAPSEVLQSIILSKVCSYKVKELLIRESEGLKVVTLGIQHLVYWTLVGRQLESLSAHLSHETETMQLGFLAAIDMHDLIIAAADNGGLYIWKNENLIKRVPAHEKSILSIDKNVELSLVITGGLDGHIIIWRLTIQSTGFGVMAHLDSLREYSLLDPSGLELSFAVQSLCMGQLTDNSCYTVIVGTKTGEIYEISCQENSEHDRIAHLTKMIDHESIVSMSIEATGTYLYGLSQLGGFCIWLIDNLKLVFYQTFEKRGIRVIALQTRGQVLLSFFDEILVIEVVEVADSLNYNVIQGFNITESSITEVAINLTETVLAVASSTDQPQVDLYQIGEEEFISDKNLHGFRSDIVRLDFSTDGYYLSCEDAIGDILIYEEETQNIAHLEQVEFDIEWTSEGLRHSQTLRTITQIYKGNSKVTAINQNATHSKIAVGDQFGVIKLFQVPYTSSTPIGVLNAHTNEVNIVIFTRDEEYLLSYSEKERCLIKWKV